MIAGGLVMGVTQLLKQVLRYLFRLLFLLLFRVKVRGDLRVFNQDPLLLIANHTSFLDGLLLDLFLPISPVFVIHESVVRHWYFKLILSFSDYLLVASESPINMKKVIQLLETGRSVVVFPEGRITMTGSLMKIYEGPAFVAMKMQAKLVPIVLEGTVNTYFSRSGEHRPRRLFPAIRIHIFPATEIVAESVGSAKLKRQNAREQIRKIMQMTLFKSYEIETIWQAFCKKIALYGRKFVLIEDIKQVEYRYQDLLQASLLLTRVLERHLVKDIRYLGLLLPNIMPTLALILGLSARVKVPVMLNYTAGEADLKDACLTAQVSVILTSRQFVKQIGFADKLARLNDVRVIYLEDLRAEITWIDKAWLLIYALWFPKRFERKTDIYDPAVVLFTSGSEGKPKGVVLSHTNILTNIAQISSVVDFSCRDKILNVLPMFHSFGLTAGALLPVLSGMRVFLYPSPLHYRVIPEVAYDKACTILLGTNTFLAHYGKFAHPYDFFNLRYVIAGAEKLSEQVINLWAEKFGLRIFEGYGVTETSPVLTINTPMAYKKGSVGELLPNINAQLIPLSGMNRGGILHVKGSNVMMGYLKFDLPGVIQAPSSLLGDGWYETGDVIEIDEAGFVFILGRVKRFAKIAGEMVSLDVSELIAKHASPSFFHASSAVVDTQKGEAIVLFSTDKNLKRAALQKSAKILGYSELAIAKKVVYLEALPILATGKMDYVRLREMAGSHEKSH